MITLYGGLYFMKDYLHEAFIVILLIIILACNFWFFSLWVYMFMAKGKYEFMRSCSKCVKPLTMLSKRELAEFFNQPFRDDNVDAPPQGESGEVYDDGKIPDLMEH
jgi:hypothetical protein